jgi:pantoate--beta-alanine ligase
VSVEIIVSPQQMQERSRRARAAGQRIAFVPTMGYLHDGHVSLLRAGRERGELLVLSIFVNPMQFGPTEDLARYPRDLEGDLAKAAGAGCDLAFCPEAAGIYPPGFETRVEVTQTQEGLCGAHRPGHFAGVATVVLKLINIVQPDVMLLGEKDYQQLMVLKRMVRDLHLPVEVVGCPLIRDADGVAMSSRNAYLDAELRSQARGLSSALFAARAAFASGERRRQALLDAAARVLAGFPGVRVEYLELRDAASLRGAPEVIDEVGAAKVVLLVAGFVGKTRLIDNLVLG